MKKISRKLCLTLGLSMFLGGQSLAADFNDVASNHWAYPYVAQAQEAGLISGTGNNNFSPERTMTYGEFSVIVLNGAYDGVKSNKSTDWHWSDPYLNVLQDNGLFVDSNGNKIDANFPSYYQDNTITRVDVCTIVARLLEAGGFPSGTISQATAFNDVSNSTVSSGQLQDIADVVNNGIMSGTAGSFNPNQNMNRAEASVIIKRMLDANLLCSEEGYTDDTTTEDTTTEDTTTENTTTEDTATEDTTEESQSAEEVQAAIIQGVFDLVNAERATEGLPALIWYDDLMDAAQFKSEEMSELNYFTHDSPVYGSFSGIIDLYISGYTAAGENIAKGQQTPESVMNSWMNSSGHKANILNSNFTHIGIGYADGYWTQQFVRSNYVPTTEGEDTTTEEEDTTPEVEETTPEVEETTPEVEETTPEVEETTPEVEETTPEVEETTPEVEETTPEEEVTTPEEEVATPEEEVTTPEEEEETPTAEEIQAALIQGVFDLVNEERAAVGLDALVWHDALMDAAQFKSEEMYSLNYFAHESPVYGDFDGIIKLYVSSYRTLGENIAKGQQTAAAVMNSWMNSSGHKANILNSSFTHIGIGYAGGYWTQQFLG